VKFSKKCDVIIFLSTLGLPDEAPDGIDIRAAMAIAGLE
jgi:hypothetical protein